MRVDRRLFPYPVLHDGGDDYLHSGFSATMNMKQDGPNTLAVSCVAALRSDDLKALIDDGKAAYAFHIGVRRRPGALRIQTCHRSARRLSRCPGWTDGWSAALLLQHANLSRIFPALTGTRITRVCPSVCGPEASSPITNWSRSPCNIRTFAQRPRRFHDPAGPRDPGRHCTPLPGTQPHRHCARGTRVSHVSAICRICALHADAPRHGASAGSCLPVW